MEDVIRQIIKSESLDPIEKAIKYYSILSIINGLKMTEREIQLTAYIAVQGTINYQNFRIGFCERFGSSNATVNNMISRLTKLNILKRVSSKIRVNPVILLDFKKEIALVVKLHDRKTN